LPAGPAGRGLPQAGARPNVLLPQASAARQILAGGVAVLRGASGGERKMKTAQEEVTIEKQQRSAWRLDRSNPAR